MVPGGGGSIGGNDGAGPGVRSLGLTARRDTALRPQGSSLLDKLDHGIRGTEVIDHGEGRLKLVGVSLERAPARLCRNAWPARWQ